MREHTVGLDLEHVTLENAVMVDRVMSLQDASVLKGIKVFSLININFLLL